MGTKSAERQWTVYPDWQRSMLRQQAAEEKSPGQQQLLEEIDEFFFAKEAFCKENKINFSPVIEVWNDFCIAVGMVTSNESVGEISLQFQRVQESLTDDYLLNVGAGEKVVPEVVSEAVRLAYAATGIEEIFINDLR